MNSSPAVDVAAVSYRYRPRRVRAGRRASEPQPPADRLALDDVSLQVAAGECFALLGPNGGGKTTLFRLLTTLIPLQSGRISIFESDLNVHVAQARCSMGVVFQASSLDRKLTVAENLHQQAVLYGIPKPQAVERIGRQLSHLGLSDRAGDLVEKLSGGQRRRVEIAKGLIHEPSLLLMDEPTTGLDPAVRSDVWRHIDQLRRQHGVTVLLTTHLLDEAERVDRIGILSQGRIVALDAPRRLREELGQRVITVQTGKPEHVSRLLSDKYGVETQPAGDDGVRCLDATGKIPMTEMLDVLGDSALAVTVGKPSLEDVFMEKTGHCFGSLEH